MLRLVEMVRFYFEIVAMTQIANNIAAYSTYVELLIIPKKTRLFFLSYGCSLARLFLFYNLDL